MTDRERLIEIIEQARAEAVSTIGSMNNGFAAWYADKLLAAGVVFKVEKRPNNTVVIANIPEMVDDYLREYKKQKIGSFGVIPEEHVGWIPVTERLPEEWTEVLVFARCRPDADGFVQTAVYIGIPGCWRVTWNNCMLECNIVTHWKPLPEPPKEEHNG